MVSTCIVKGFVRSLDSAVCKFAKVMLLLSCMASLWSVIVSSMAMTPNVINAASLLTRFNRLIHRYTSNIGSILIRCVDHNMITATCSSSACSQSPALDQENVGPMVNQVSDKIKYCSGWPNVDSQRGVNDNKGAESYQRGSNVNYMCCTLPTWLQR